MLMLGSLQNFSVARTKDFSKAVLTIALLKEDCIKFILSLV